MIYVVTKGIFLFPIIVLWSIYGFGYSMLNISILIFLSLIVFHRGHRNGRTPRHYMLLRVIAAAEVVLIALMTVLYGILDFKYLPWDELFLWLTLPFLGVPMVLGIFWAGYLLIFRVVCVLTDWEEANYQDLKDRQADGFCLFWDDQVAPFVTSDPEELMYMTKNQREILPDFEVDPEPDTSGPYGGKPIVCGTCGANNAVDDRPCYHCGTWLVLPEEERVDWRSQGDFWDNEIAAERRKKYTEPIDPD